MLPDFSHLDVTFRPPLPVFRGPGKPPLYFSPPVSCQGRESRGMKTALGPRHPAIFHPKQIFGIQVFTLTRSTELLLQIYAQIALNTWNRQCSRMALSSFIGSRFINNNNPTLKHKQNICVCDRAGSKRSETLRIIRFIKTMHTRGKT